MSHERHNKALMRMERRALNLHEVERAYKFAAQELFMLYDAGFGTDEDRVRAIDHLEDAGLVPRHER